MKFISTVVAAAALFELALAQISGEATCYFANGTALPKTPGYLEYQACPGSSICCGINRSNIPNGDPANGFTRDECLPNGLCQNRETVNGIGKTSYWVDFCTNSDVTATECLNVCQQTKNVVGNTPMTPCDGTATSDRWCCGSSTDCCTSNVGIVHLAQVLGGSLSSSVSSATMSSTSLASSAATSTAASTASSSPIASASASASPTSTSSGATNETKNSSSGLSSGAIAGIVIGALAAVALIGAAVFFARRAAMWKKKASTPGVPEMGGAPAYTDAQPAGAYEAAGGYGAPVYQDKQAYGYHSEIDGGTAPQELPAETRGGELSAESVVKR